MPLLDNYLEELHERRSEDDPVRYQTNLRDLETEARAVLPADAYAYIAAGAGNGDTVAANRDAFQRWRIVPRVLRQVEDEARHQSTVLGANSRVWIAPVGAQRKFHPDGELAVARAARALDIPIILSPAASYRLEEVARANGDGNRWYELVWSTDDKLIEKQLVRARAAKYKGLVVSVDLRRTGWRPDHIDRGNLPMWDGIGTENLADDLDLDGLGPLQDQITRRWTEVMTDTTRTWSDLDPVRRAWSGPIVLKGIQHVDDARRAVDAGADGIVVSNHGGRQVDGAIASLDALPPIVDAVGDQITSTGERFTVLFDGGIRCGADIIKALALGAHAVLLGRPLLYGLAVGGESGVRHVLRSILADYDQSMGNACYDSPDELTRAALMQVR